MTTTQAVVIGRIFGIARALGHDWSLQRIDCPLSLDQAQREYDEGLAALKANPEYDPNLDDMGPRPSASGMSRSGRSLWTIYENGTALFTICDGYTVKLNLTVDPDGKQDLDVKPGASMEDFRRLSRLWSAIEHVNLTAPCSNVDCDGEGEEIVYRKSP